jgi:hypothetical protein
MDKTPPKIARKLQAYLDTLDFRDVLAGDSGSDPTTGRRRNADLSSRIATVYGGAACQVVTSAWPRPPRIPAIDFVP